MRLPPLWPPNNLMSPKACRTHQVVVAHVKRDALRPREPARQRAHILPFGAQPEWEGAKEPLEGPALHGSDLRRWVGGKADNCNRGELLLGEAESRPL